MTSPLGFSGTTSRIPFSNCCFTTVRYSSSLCIGFLVFVWHVLTSLVSVPCLKVNMHDQASKVIALYNSHLLLIVVVDLWNIHESNHVPSPHPSDQEHTCANSLSLEVTKNIFFASAQGMVDYPAVTDPNMVNSSPESVFGFRPRIGGSIDWTRWISAAPRIMCAGNLSAVACCSLNSGGYKGRPPWAPLIFRPNFFFGDRYPLI